MNKTFQLVKGVWKLFVLFALIVMCFSYAMFQGGFVSWFLFYSFLPFSLYCICLSFYSLKELEITRQIPKTDYNAGEPLKVMVNVKRNSRFPIFYFLIEDQMDQTLMYSQQ